MRRILRIWPLFFAMLLFAYLTPTLLNIVQLPFSNAGYEPDWRFSVLFLENYKIMMEGTSPNTAPLEAMWTLCVEEHFYITWGLLLYFLKVKYVPRLIGISILITLISRVVFSFYQIQAIDLFTNLSYFALGSIPAWIYIVQPQVLDKVEKLHPSIKYYVVAITITYVLITSNNFRFSLYLLDATFMGALFALGILFTLPEKNKLYISRNSILGKWGIYTYGLYLFHTVIIAFFNRLYEYYGIGNYVFVAISAFITSLVVSYWSYHLFERKFLLLKKYYR